MNKIRKELKELTQAYKELVKLVRIDIEFKQEIEGDLLATKTLLKKCHEAVGGIDTATKFLPNNFFEEKEVFEFPPNDPVDKIFNFLVLLN